MTMRHTAKLLWAEGRSAKSIAHEVGMTYRQFLHYVSAHREDFPHRRPRKRHANSDESERQVAYDMWRSGMSTWQVGEAIGRSQGTVAKWKARYGWER